MIRKMNSLDYTQVIDMWEKTKGIGINEVDDSKEGFNGFLKRNPTTCFVYIVDDKIVGTIQSGHDGRRGHIYHLAVLDTFRGQGIGKKLVQNTLQSLKEAGIIKVSLVVFKNNGIGNRFWINNDFEKRDDLNYYNIYTS